MSRAALAIVATPHSETEAHLMAAALRGEGIPAHVENANALAHDTSLFQLVFPVRVPWPLRAAAQDVLQRSRHARARRREERPGPTGIERELRTIYGCLALGLLIPPVGLVSGPMACVAATRAQRHYAELLLDERELEHRIDASHVRAQGYTLFYYLLMVVLVACLYLGFLR